MNQYKKILEGLNIEALNEMQKAALDVFQKSDLVLISPTGTGKTLAFLLPLLKVLNPEIKAIQVVIVVPMRELALQIEQVFKKMNTGFKISCCYGGHAVRIEKNNLIEPPAVLVGTPGRITQHIQSRNIDIANASVLILDEFDKSLESGFDDEMAVIVRSISAPKIVLTSATVLPDLPPFVKLKHPVFLDFSSKTDVPSALKLKCIRATGDDKTETLLYLISKLGNTPTLIFCNHREAVSRISKQFAEFKIDHAIYHGKLEQPDREKALIKFRNGSINFLITTDLAARGLDIPEIENVIHYQLPVTEEVMIHRNGRTARMHAAGTAYFLLDLKDYLPDFISIPFEEKITSHFKPLPPVKWKTLFIAAGKKDKINKMDIAGMLMQKGKLEKDELGKIEVLDFTAYAAIKSDKFDSAFRNIKDEKIKGRKIKMALAS